MNAFLSLPINLTDPDLCIFTDACNQGWGAHLGDITLKGTWSPSEKSLHINILEMRTIYRALEQIQLKPRSFILVSIDNT